MVDDDGNLFVADFSNHRVQRIAASDGAVTTVAGGLGRGATATQLDEPVGLAVDGAGNLLLPMRRTTEFRSSHPAAVMQ